MTIIQIFKVRLTQIKFTFQQITRQTTPQEEPKGENHRSTHRLLQLQWTFQWLTRGITSFKLIEPSPGSDSHEQEGLPTHNQVTVALIMDCPTITIHAGKCHKALIDSGAAISLIRYSTYQLIDDSFKTPIQPTTTKLNTADVSPMMALGMTAIILEQQISNSSCIICDRLLDTEIIFGIDVQKQFSLYYAWDKENNCYIQKDGRFLTYTRNCEQKATMGIVKLTLKIPPRHNGIIPIKIKGHTLAGHLACFISDQDFTKGKDPNINITNDIHIIKGKTSVNVLVSNYTNKHIMFNKEEYVRCLEPTIEDIEEEDNPQFWANSDDHTTNSITTQWMMAEQVEPDTFKPPCHKLKQHIEAKLEALLKEYASQFAQDETSIRTTPLTEMMIDTGTSEPVSQNPYPIANNHYQWVKDKIEKFLTAKVIQESQSSWSAPIIVFPKGDGGKCLVIDYCTLNKVTRKFIWPIPKVEDIFSQLNSAKYFSTLDLQAGYHDIPLE